MGEMLALAGIGAAQGAVNSAGNYFSIQAQKEAQRELQNEQNEFQKTSNDVDRAWQEKTWIEHFLAENSEYAKRLGLQQQNWKSQFDLTNQYNAPSAQMARLRAAGINPSAMMQNSGLASLGSSSASPSASSAAAPVGSAFSAHSVSPAPAPSFGGLSSAAQSFSSVAQMADSVAAIKRSGADVTRINALLPSEVETAANNAAISNQKRILSEIETNVAAAWLDKKAGAEFSKLVADSYAAFSSGDLSKANELLSSANERLVSLEGEIKAEQRSQLLANLQELQKVYETEQEKNRASAVASRASAVASHASAEQALSQKEFNDVLAETERQLRSGKVTAQVLSNATVRIENQLKQRENVRDIATNEWQIWKILQECKRAGYMTAEQLQKWKIAVKDNDSYELRMILQEVNSALPSVVVPIAP